MQKDIIESVLKGEDVLALLPTGGGKSICFQVPAMMMDGVCLVISPLIALMKDQVLNLQKKNIPAVALHSGLTPFEVKRVLQKASYGEYKFLYLSPERLETRLFKEYLPAIEVSLLAVDEAHCISQWGYDFRPPYLNIAAIREELPRVPVLALTASATPRVQQDIMEKLDFSGKKLFKQSFEKPNLSYSVFAADSKINKVTEILNRVPGTAIVYCGTRKQTKEVANLLAMQGVSTDFYHAGLSQEERSTKQDAWINNETRVIVCTNAFGMGIDKPDVRVVVHYDTPDNLENYYQEAGRAGRDGKRAYAVLLCNANDVETLRKQPDIKYPSIADIRLLYQALADYLHIPIGAGEGVYYDFDASDFIKKFGLDTMFVLNGIKMLEQEGYLAFNESVFLQSQVCFSTSREMMESFEQVQPALAEVMKCLLRTYEGIYDNRVSVYEKQIARMCRMTPEDARNALLQLAAYGIIEYFPQKETPQLQYIENRAQAEYLVINVERYAARKKLYTERIEKMIAYVHLSTECRSKFISAYFGDDGVRDCGICDNCLERKSKPLSGKDMQAIEKQLYELLQQNELTTTALLEQMKAVRKEQVWEVLRYLQSERKIEIDDAGKIFRR